MVSELVPKRIDIKIFNPMANFSSSSASETLLTIQNFHQCSSLVTLKLNQTNFLLWKSQVLPLVRLGIQHHFEKGREPYLKITIDDKEANNPAYTTWLNNDGLLTTWLLGTIAEEFLLNLDDTSTAYRHYKKNDRIVTNTFCRKK